MLKGSGRRKWTSLMARCGEGMGCVVMASTHLPIPHLITLSRGVGGQDREDLLAVQGGRPEEPPEGAGGGGGEAGGGAGGVAGQAEEPSLLRLGCQLPSRGVGGEDREDLLAVQGGRPEEPAEGAGGGGGEAGGGAGGVAGQAE